MGGDREIQARRREAIMEILMGDQVITEQQELVDRLRARGIPATQSSISRDLKALGAVRVQGHYEIPSWVDEDDGEILPFRRVTSFVRKVKQAGPHQLLLVTNPGAGRVVAQAIEDSRWEDIVGTVNGDSSVLILTENFIFQRLVYERLKYFLGEDNDIIEVRGES